MGQPPEQAAPPPAAGGVPVGPQGEPLAEWWKRLVAILIDGFIVGIPANIFGGILFSGLFAATAPRFDPVTGQIVGGRGFMAGILAAWGGFLIVWLVITAAYYTFLHSQRGQTVGKMALKIKVVDDTSGDLIPPGRALVRWGVPQALAIFTCGIGALINGLWPLWDPKRQTFHDKAAKTVVIDLG